MNAIYNIALLVVGTLLLASVLYVIGIKCFRAMDKAINHINAACIRGQYSDEKVDSFLEKISHRMGDVS